MRIAQIDGLPFFLHRPHHVPGSSIMTLAGLHLTGRLKARMDLDDSGTYSDDARVRLQLVGSGGSARR